MAWLAAEFLVFLGVRVARGEWRSFKARSDGVAQSLFTNFGQFPMVLAVPFPQLRNPLWLGPDLYCFSLIYSLFVSNPLMIFVAFRVNGGSLRIHETEAWLGLAAAVGVALFGAGVLWASMTPSYRKTFYQRRTLREHIEKWHWDTRVVARIGKGHDAARGEGQGVARAAGQMGRGGGSVV